MKKTTKKWRPSQKKDEPKNEDDPKKEDPQKRGQAQNWRWPKNDYDPEERKEGLGVRSYPAEPYSCLQFLGQTPYYVENVEAEVFLE